MKKRVFLGIDTSNYTTSLALCDESGEILENYKVLLPVKEGENGLRQSDAVFAHVKNFQIISSYIREKHEDYEILAVGYSKYPRDVENSYMPCFLVGRALAEVISSLYNLELFEFSHQKGHVSAAIYSSGAQIDSDFIAFHVSGGTTEILHIKPSEADYKIELIGGSDDLHAGQAIDRIGVKMGLPFPCGKHIEALALENNKKIPSPKISVKGFKCNMSGLENLASKLYSETSDKQLTAAFTLEFVYKTIAKLTENLRIKFQNHKIVYAGGVMSNAIIKSKLNKKFDGLYFAKPEFSADNASGIALLTQKRYFSKEK